VVTTGVGPSADAPSPRPFLRWAGSKRWLVPVLLARRPEEIGTYYEPFLGGGSLFFALQPRSAVLSDALSPLVETYRAVRDNPTAVIGHLRRMKPDRELFEAVRKRHGRGAYRRAADFIYLNRTGWNALYRVNSRGQYNVPYGRPKTDRLIDEANLKTCAQLLAQPDVEVLTTDFEDAVSGANAGDLIFFDPPYVTGHNNNGFVDYNEQLFRWSDQKRLARLANELNAGGVHVIVTNAQHDAVLELYAGFRSESVSRWSTIAGAKESRGPVSEAVLWSKGLIPRDG